MATRTILITGGSRGIGAATAIMAAEQGYDVALTYKQSERDAQSVAAGIRDRGRRALIIQADAADEQDTKRTFAQAIDAFGYLDVLVYNAGISGNWQRLDEVETLTIRETLDTNLFGCIIHAREAVRVMSTSHGGRGGNIVLLSSRAATYGAAGRYVWYAASKGGVNSFAVGLAREVGEEGIRVNAVSPGPIRTGITPPEIQAVTAQATALKRAGEPHEVASVILFLAGDASTYVTGAEVLVGGGR